MADITTRPPYGVVTIDHGELYKIIQAWTIAERQLNMVQRVQGADQIGWILDVENVQVFVPATEYEAWLERMKNTDDAKKEHIARLRRMINVLRNRAHSLEGEIAELRSTANELEEEVREAEKDD